ncbi:MAG: hypothetical protein R3A13_09925, partial [Bdellovibrionota bacterium]
MLYAIAMFLGRWKGLPSFEFLESDIANSAGMAAAKLRPDLFHGDALLGDSRNIDFYHVAQTPLMQWIANLTGNFGTAAVVLLIPHVFFQLSGFYILGKVLFNDRIWAIFLTFLTAQYVHLNIGDFWGLYFDIMPRFLFQALLPFFLAAAIYYRNLPKTWPIILFLFGPMMYAHPVSTPSCALAIWLGFFAVLPSKWSYRRKVSQMFLSGFCFLISASPFLINYLGSHQHGATTNFSAVMEIMKWRFDPAFFNIPQAVQGHFQTGFKSVGYYYGVLATIPLLILCLYRRKNLRTLSMILLWIIGLAFTSIVIPFIEQEICNYYKIAPLEVDLLRNTRYLVPIFMLILLWTLFELAKLPLYWRRSHLASGIKLFVTLLAAVVSLNHHGPVEVDPLKNTFNS